MKRILSIIAVFTILALLTGAFALPAAAIDDTDTGDDTVVVTDDGTGDDDVTEPDDPGDTDPDDGNPSITINVNIGNVFARIWNWLVKAWNAVVEFFKNISGLSFILNIVF